MEIWKDIPGYEGMYFVSNEGRVLSKRRKSPAILAQRKHRGGYRQVMLSVHGKAQQPLVHRLVAMVFVPNPNGYDFVNHKDENKANNHADNLEWCTKSYNVTYSLDRHPERKEMYASSFGCNGNREGRIDHTEKVLQYTKNGKLIRTFASVVEAHKATGIKNSAIIACCKGKQKTAFGYIWKFD